MTNNEKISKLINAAYRVAEYPTVAAYRSTSYGKKIGYPLLRELIEALEPLVTEEARQELASRLKAITSANDDHAEWRAGAEIRESERLKREEAERHPFRPDDSRAMGLYCLDCPHNRQHPAHYTASGVFIEEREES